MSDRDINIGGDSKGSVNVTGDNNVVTFQKVTLPPPESVDIGQTLAELREALGTLALSGPEHVRISESLEQAAEAAKADVPDKASIGSHVEKALTVAKTANNFVDVCGKLGPYVASAASWLGENWHKLLSLANLTM